MPALASPLIVLDTSVVAAAALGSPDASSAAVVDAVAAGDVRLALSDDYLDEMGRTMGKPYLEENASVGRAFRIALVLAYMGRSYRPARHEWPSIPDREDWWLLDLAFEAGADAVVTWNTRDIGPGRSLGFTVQTPPRFLEDLG